MISVEIVMRKKKERKKGWFGAEMDAERVCMVGAGRGGKRDARRRGMRLRALCVGRSGGMDASVSRDGVF